MQQAPNWEALSPLLTLKAGLTNFFDSHYFKLCALSEIFFKYVYIELHSAVQKF